MVLPKARPKKSAKLAAHGDGKGHPHKEPPVRKLACRQQAQRHDGQRRVNAGKSAASISRGSGSCLMAAAAMAVIAPIMSMSSSPLSPPQR